MQNKLYAQKAYIEKSMGNGNNVGIWIPKNVKVAKALTKWFDIEMDNFILADQRMVTFRKKACTV